MNYDMLPAESAPHINNQNIIAKDLALKENKSYKTDFILSKKTFGNDLFMALCLCSLNDHKYEGNIFIFPH